MILPIVKRRALGFLNEQNIDRKQEELLKEKLRKISNTNIGRKLGVTASSPRKQVPLTSYGFYRSFFESPREGDFLYPLDDYVKAMTSGSGGKPKIFLLPKTGLWENITKTGLSFMFICTHDGEKMNFEVGDTIYRNVPGGSYSSGYLTEIFKKDRSGWVNNVPDINLPYKDKVEYFIENYWDIDIAYMTVTALLDDIATRIDEPLNLKGFVTQDRSASVLKDKIRDFIGTYPKATYGSTETSLSGIASIEFPGSFIMDWRILYCEFIPEDVELDVTLDIIEDLTETVPLMDVEAGKRYKFIATPFKNDLTRYITTDIFECVSNGDSILGTDLPVFSFYARSDKLISMHNFTRISEEEILNALKDAGVPFVDFTTRVELESSREYMVIYLEVSSPMSEDEVTSRLNQEFLKVDKDWRDLTNFMGYTPLKVHLLPKGSFTRYLSVRQGLPKVERIDMNEERLKELLSYETH
ncbi:MAG TPA: GH3 auxin-responsive promoter family protein [Patescibacteria group bacterium]|nr:GH3 auxin-responsive promoter family protein [Patescibacteria group bacterium]